MKKVAIIMGSDSDLPVVKPAWEELKKLGIPCEAHVMSAHRTPAAAGMAAHLAGALAANTTLPIIGIPVKGGAMDGLDALLATVMMPSGIPVATVALNGAKNAAVLAAQMLAIEDAELAAKLDAARQDMAAQIEAKDKALQQQLNG